MSTKPRERKINKPNAREDAPPRAKTRRAIPLVFVADAKSDQIEQWKLWLRKLGMPPPEQLALRTVRSGQSGYLLPSNWLKTTADERTDDLIRFLSGRRMQPADQATRQGMVRRAS